MKFKNAHFQKLKNMIFKNGFWSIIFLIWSQKWVVFNILNEASKIIALFPK